MWMLHNALCVECNMKKRHGRPVDTTAKEGYGVSLERSLDTTKEEGYGVSQGDL